MKTTDARRSMVTALLVLAIGFALSRTAASPASAGTRPLLGRTPGDALDQVCTWQSIPPVSHVWYRLPSTADAPSTVRLMPYPRFLNGMSFQVYVARPADAVEEGEAWGLLGYGKTHALVELQWSGEPLDGAVYYVDVVNSQPTPAEYSLCNDADPSGLLAGSE